MCPLCCSIYATTGLKDLRSALVSSSTKLSQFSLCSVDDIQKVLKTSSKASCHLDPIPTSILHQLLCLVPVITNIVNQSLTASHFPSQLKSAIVKPLLKKSTLDPEIFKNYRPVSNLSFVSKVIKKSTGNCKSVTQTYGRKRSP